MNPDFVNPMVLAYLGDSIIELMTREYLIRESGLAKPHELYQAARNYVSSQGHAGFIFYCLENNLLSEQEIKIYKRGRNAKNNKNETNEHRHSTGLEALFGHLYLNDQKDRMNELFDLMKDYVHHEINMKQIRDESEEKI
ncbi:MULTISPECIES: ribonuclease III domain-containing protein [Coprobacillaceae]|uniref:ribonuclease III domain-containing protein n=1 Tax=Coprobacillaceae TaxID=2810280 RepID=UPI000E55617A|nr:MULTISPECIES: ribonuclease III domain-containing protein [Coprobacillaceae]RHM61481.1 ribonuclease III [Coprobacillus sp. AF33-1AC]RHS93974.1 ribonuclease III [Erysipelatoclostridium sp. AM42-17]